MIVVCAGNIASEAKDIYNLTWNCWQLKMLYWNWRYRDSLFINVKIVPGYDEIYFWKSIISINIIQFVIRFLGYTVTSCSSSAFGGSNFCRISRSRPILQRVTLMCGECKEVLVMHGTKVCLSINSGFLEQWSSIFWSSSILGAV